MAARDVAARAGPVNPSPAGGLSAVKDSAGSPVPCYIGWTPGARIAGKIARSGRLLLVGLACRAALSYLGVTGKVASVKEARKDDPPSLLTGGPTQCTARPNPQPPDLTPERIRDLDPRIVDGRFRKGPVPADTSPAAQQRRAVKRWHGNARTWTLTVTIPRRNRKLVAMALDGCSVRFASMLSGMSKSHVHRIISKVLRYRAGRWERRVSHAGVLTAPPMPPGPCFDGEDPIPHRFTMFGAAAMCTGCGIEPPSSPILPRYSLREGNILKASPKRGGRLVKVWGRWIGYRFVERWRALDWTVFGWADLQGE